MGNSVLDDLLSKTGGAANGMFNGPNGVPAGSGGSGSSGTAPTAMPSAPMGGSNVPGPGGSMGQGAPGVPAGGAPSGTPGGTIVPRDNWSPLSQFIGRKRSGGLGSNGMENPQAPPSFGDAARPKPAAASNHTRTEFIIVFFWKEPTPSDKLRNDDPDARPAAPAAPVGQPVGQPPRSAPPAGSSSGEEKPLSAVTRGGYDPRIG